MNWIWDFLAALGKLGRNAWNEAAKQAELPRMREQGRKGISPNGNADNWGLGDSSAGDKVSQELDTGWGGCGGGFWRQDNSDPGGVFGSTDTDFGSTGGGDFGTGDFGGCIGGGLDGGGDGGSGE